jgi:sulfate adenylyltransferase subunit 2
MNKLSHLKDLESESIYVLREVISQFQNPVVLFSGGKDSIIIAHLAKKAFFPAKIPFPFLHIDTGHNFPETIVFRDDLIKELGIQLLVVLLKKVSIKVAFVKKAAEMQVEMLCKLQHFWM